VSDLTRDDIREVLLETNLKTERLTLERLKAWNPTTYTDDSARSLLVRVQTFRIQALEQQLEGVQLALGYLPVPSNDTRVPPNDP
jgi:hypothetical protein